MEDEIAAYLDAAAKLKEAEKSLDAKVGPAIGAAINNKDELVQLTYTLPDGYKGLRRVYEAIIRLEDQPS